MFLVVTMISLSISLIWKWNKSLLAIIMLEAISTVIMASFFLWSSGYSFFLFLLFSFFVSEALILLSSLYSSIRIAGSITSSLIFN